jgi:hypothetical protein
MKDKIKISRIDWLLPMLMNGQVLVGDVEMMGMAAEPLGEYKVRGK